MTSNQPNRFAGSCGFCGSKVLAGAGTYSRQQGVRHVEGDCKTTTKTYTDSVLSEQHLAGKAAIAAAYAEAGLSVYQPHRVEHATDITGPGIRCLVGGYARDAVFPHGVRIFRAGELVSDTPRPRVETSSYWADRLAEEQQIIALILHHATTS